VQICAKYVKALKVRKINKKAIPSQGNLTMPLLSTHLHLISICTFRMVFSLLWEQIGAFCHPVAKKLG